MKTFVPLIAVTLLLTGHTSFAAESKRTAEYILANPKAYDNKEVSLDVAFVKPVQWVSPIPSPAFFHAVTIDRHDKKMGGSILVAVDSPDSAKFAKKYGMDFDGRRDRDTLKGKFIQLPRGKNGGREIWAIDTTGTLLDTVKQAQVTLPAGGGKVGPGDKVHGKRPHPRPPKQKKN